MGIRTACVVALTATIAHGAGIKLTRPEYAGARPGIDGGRGERPDALRELPNDFVISRIPHKQDRRVWGLGIKLEDEVGAGRQWATANMVQAIRRGCGGFFTEVKDVPNFTDKDSWWEANEREGIRVVAVIRLIRKAGLREQYCRIHYITHEPDARFHFPPVEQRYSRVKYTDAVRLLVQTYPLTAQVTGADESGAVLNVGSRHGVRSGDRFVPIDVKTLYRYDSGLVAGAGVAQNRARPEGDCAPRHAQVFIRQPRIGHLVRVPFVFRCLREVGSKQTQKRPQPYLSIKVYPGLFYQESTDGSAPKSTWLEGVIPEKPPRGIQQGVTNWQGECRVSVPLGFPFVLDVKQFCPDARGQQAFVPWMKTPPRVYQLTGESTTPFEIHWRGDRSPVAFQVEGGDRHLWTLYIDGQEMGEFAHRSPDDVRITEGRHRFRIVPNDRELLSIPYHRETERRSRRAPLPFSLGRRWKPFSVPVEGVIEAKLWRDVTADVWAVLERDTESRFDVDVPDHEDGKFVVSVSGEDIVDRVTVEANHPQRVEVALLLTWPSHESARQTPWTRARDAIEPAKRIALVQKLLEHPDCPPIWLHALEVTLAGLTSEKAATDFGAMREADNEALLNVLRGFEDAEQKLCELVHWPVATQEGRLTLRHQIFRTHAQHTLAYYQALLQVEQNAGQHVSTILQDPMFRELVEASRILSTSGDQGGTDDPAATEHPVLKRIKDHSSQRIVQLRRFINDEYNNPPPWMTDEHDALQRSLRQLDDLFAEWVKKMPTIEPTSGTGKADPDPDQPDDKKPGTTPDPDQPDQKEPGTGQDGGTGRRPPPVLK